MIAVETWKLVDVKLPSFSIILTPLMCVCVCFHCLAAPPMACGTSLTRDQTHAPAVEAWSLNLWTAKEVLNV